MILKHVKRNFKVKLFQEHLELSEHFNLIEREGILTGLRVIKPNNRKVLGKVFYLPGRWQNSLYWAMDNPLKDFRIYLAINGFEVATMDYRTSFIRKMKTNIEEIENWNTKDFLDDITFTQGVYFDKYGKEQIYIVGFSMGAALSFLHENTAAHDKCKGLIVLDGGIKKPNRTNSYDIRKVIDENTSKINYNPSWDRTFRRLALQALTSQKNETVNKSLSLMDSPDLLRLLLTEDPIWPLVQVKEIAAISDYDVHPTLKLDTNIKKIYVPTLAIAAFNGVSQDKHLSLESINATSSKDKTIIKLPQENHMDVLTGENVIDNVNKPMLNWLLKINE